MKSITESIMDVDDLGIVRWYNSEWELHREDGPAVEFSNGTKHWFINGKEHRVDGPAVECYGENGGNKYWYIDGRLHRLDGPAIECEDGNEYWYIDGVEIDCEDNEEFLRIVALKSLL
jgi:hypothetical protein